jgi:beta-lactam-binding protein with PASTA domain
MRTCQSCGAENPPDRDFCSCGEYLRWEPTGFVQAITPEMAAEAAAQSTPPSPPQPDPAQPAATPPPPPQPAAPPPQVTPAAPPTPEGDNGHGNGHAQPAAPPPPPPPSPPTANSLVAAQPPQSQPPAAPVAKTLVRGAVPPPAPASAAAPAQQEPASIVLRLPEGDPAKGEVLHQAVEPGQRERVLALVRNQSGIVDNYDLRIEGMPEDWYSIFPATVYLVPFGAGGMYEQEVEVHLHPPRGPEAEARVWDLKVVADSKANRVVAASAPLALHIEPYIETATALRPQRKKGRRKADFDVTVANKANAPVLVALDGEDPDGEMTFAFNRPPQEIPAGASVKTQMRVRPPKQIWIGRAQDRRLEVKTVTGEEAAARAAAEPLSAEVLAHAQPEVKKKWWQRRARQPQIPGVYGPRVFKPQLYPPDVQMGPGGLNVRMPQFRAPQVQGPQLKSLNASQLAKGGVKLPGRGGPATPAAPLLPTQGVFRQKAWLPWWLIPVLALLLLLLFLLLRTMPQTAVVPDVVGDKSAFAAEEKLTAADLKLDPNQKQQEDEEAAPGTVLKQAPAAGEEVEKGTPVAILVAVGSGTVNVPDITEKNASDADKVLREKELTLGQASPTGADPKALIETQIPAPGEVVKRGTPVNIFYPDPTAEDKKSDEEKEKDKEKGKGATVPGAGEAAEITVPPIAKQTKEAYAKAAADLGIVPVVVKRFNDAKPNTLFATNPEPGTKVKKGAKVQLLVSVGQPKVVFTNEKDIKLVDGRNGAPLEPVAEGVQEEEDPAFNAAGTHVAYTADGRVMLKDLTKKNSKAIPLTPPDRIFGNLAWAPTGDTNLIAMNSENPDGSRDMCLASVGDETTVECIATPNLLPDRAIRWNRGGREIIAHAVKAPLPTDGSAPTFGIARWRLKQDKPAFSASAADWNKGRFVSDVKKPGKGAIDAALSPNGKQLAVVSNQGSSFFKLFLTEPGDYKLESDDAKGTSVRACKLAWRGDSQELIVVQSDVECREQTGTLSRLSPNTTRQQREVAANGDDPVYQPFTLGG